MNIHRSCFTLECKHLIIDSMVWIFFGCVTSLSWALNHVLREYPSRSTRRRNFSIFPCHRPPRLYVPLAGLDPAVPAPSQWLNWQLDERDRVIFRISENNCHICRWYTFAIQCCTSKLGSALYFLNGIPTMLMAIDHAFHNFPIDCMKWCKPFCPSVHQQLHYYVSWLLSDWFTAVDADAVLLFDWVKLKSSSSYYSPSVYSHHPNRYQ